ncbi:hypothetical protein BC829DRAFT_427284 [Chytridium lagenaria]|nr:hypothetical protein BC829DRAFT_427284 [Chytridium lagenaria]
MSDTKRKRPAAAGDVVAKGTKKRAVVEKKGKGKKDVVVKKVEAEQQIVADIPAEEPTPAIEEEEAQDVDEEMVDDIKDQLPIVPLEATKGKKNKKRVEEALQPGYEMRAYFTQFGTVLRLKLSRNKKTGNSKHYAFIEFESEDVATIVAETMDGYLLFDHVMQCKVVPKEKLHPETFDGSEKKFKVIDGNKRKG